jgi:hypothetical protein
MISGGHEMCTSRFARLVVLAIVGFFLFIFSNTSLFSSNPAIGAAQPGLTVHEWGTFTSVSGTDGQSLYWRPLIVESDLPRFVYSVDQGNSWRGLRYQQKSGTPVRVRMETPVIFFYTDQPLQVSVNVNFNEGKITEWFPRATQVSGGMIRWDQFQAIPGLHTNLPHEGRESHYYPARETDAAVLQVDGNTAKAEHEKFLFYRGVGDFNLPIVVQVSGQKLSIKDSQGSKVGKVIVFENRRGQIGYEIHQLGDDELIANRPAVGSQLDGLRRELKSMLVAEGLFEKEADTMLRTWDDSWFEPGLRVFYILPRESTDKILPLTISPEPQKLERVLVGRAEIITPEMERDLTTQIVRLTDRSASVRRTARSEIFKYGRFLEPLLAQVKRHTVHETVRLEIDRLFNEMPR